MTMSNSAAKELAKLPEHRPTYTATVKAITSLGDLDPVRNAQAEAIKILAIKIDQLFSTATGSTLMATTRAVKDLVALLSALSAPTASSSADLFAAILQDQSA